MTTADPSFTDEILQTVSGTTTAWLPLTTPWVSIAACSSQLYGQFGVGPVIAFDPYYGSVIASNQIPCLPPEVTVWFNQPTDSKTVYVLGPTFVCPAAYYPAQTLAVNSVTQEILCCPTSYTLGPILTHNPRTDFPAECYSTCTSGEYITYMTQSSLGGSWFPFTRGIQSDPWTVYGIHVNGFNVAATTTASSTSSSSTTSSFPSSTTSPTSGPTSATSVTSTPSVNTSSGLSSGAAAGIGVGVAAAILLLAILAFFLYRWRKRTANQQTPAYSSELANPSEPIYNNEPAMRQEMDARYKDPNYYGGPTHELPSQNPQTTYELR